MVFCDVVCFLKYILLKLSKEFSCCKVNAMSRAKVLCDLQFVFGAEK